MTEPSPVSAALAGLRVPAAIRDRPATDFPHRLGESPEEAAERLATATAVRRRRWDAAMPLRFASARVADLEASQGREVCARWWETPEIRTLILVGDPGRGKTHAAYAVGSQAVEDGAWAAAWTMVALNDAFRPNNDPAAYEVAQECDLLLLDDLGRERITEWTAERLQGVLDARWANNRRTIVTTNLPGGAVSERYGDPVQDRLIDAAWVVQVAGIARRARAPW